MVNFVDHSGQFAHLTTVPAQFTISKTWHAASLTPHWRGGGLPPCEKGVTKTGARKGGFPSAKEGVKKRNTSPKGPKNGWLRGGIQKLRTLYLHHPTHTLVQSPQKNWLLPFSSSLTFDKFPMSERTHIIQLPNRWHNHDSCNFGCQKLHIWG